MLTLTAIEPALDQPHAGPRERFLRLPMHVQMTRRAQQVHAAVTGNPAADHRALLTTLLLDLTRWADDCECAATEVLAMQRELEFERARRKGWLAWWSRTRKAMAR